MAKHLMRPWNRESFPAGAEEYAPDILASWLRHFPEATAKERDKEDWVENAVFLEAFERLGLDYAVLEPAKSGFISATADMIGGGNGPDAFFHTGISTTDHVIPIEYALPLQSRKALNAIGGHASSKAFSSVSGRAMRLVRPDVEEFDAAVREIIPASGKIFLKTVKKGGVGIYKIEEGSSPWQQITRQEEDLMWDMIRFEGVDTPYFSIQGVIQPTYEYRMFMVGKAPVTGAGCVERFTPIDNRELYDCAMEEKRNQSEVTDRPDIAARYLDFARTFGEAFASEVEAPLAYSLDLCIDESTGNVVPIELNPPMNLGRYASDIDAWVLAIDKLLKGR